MSYAWRKAVAEAVQGRPAMGASPLLEWTNGALSMQSANGGGEAIALDNTVTCEGYPTARCTLSSGTFTARIQLATPIRFAALRTLQLPIRFGSNEGWVTGVNSVKLFIYDATYAKQYRLSVDTSSLRSNAWTVLSCRSGAATEGWTFAGGPVASTGLDDELVSRIHILIAVPASAAGQQVWLGPLRMNGYRRGVGSIRMDGAYDSQASMALPILNGYGLRASLAVVHDLVGTAGYMTWAQIDRAAADGHEIIHHTKSGTKGGGYVNSSDWPTQADVQADIDAGYDNLFSRGFHQGIGYAVHGYLPYYAQTVSQARQDLVTAAHQAAGTKAIFKSVGDYNRLQSLARPRIVDAYAIQGAVQQSANDASAITPYFTAAEQNGEWAIATFHRFVLNGATPGSLEMKVGQFDAMCAALAAQVRAGTLDNLLLSECCERHGIVATA